MTPGLGRHGLSRAALGGAAILLAGLGASFANRPALAQAAEEVQDRVRPSEHFRVERPADLSDADALVIYERIAAEMVAGYRLSGLEQAADYRRWPRFNTTPYRSATHGERFVNNFANPIARSYGTFEDAGVMPRGTVIAKDSFAVTARGEVFSGPLFIMEKMAPGFLARSRDWRYTMIMPDGSLFGATRGQESERVEFCITCHQTAGEANDHLFFIPESYRRKETALQLKSD